MGNLLWFFVGAGAATMYAKRHSQEGSHWGMNHRCHSHNSPGPSQPLPSSPSDNSTAPKEQPYFTPWNKPTAPLSTQDNSIPQGSSSDPWASEKERIKEIGTQVGVNVLEFSESTLDTLLSSIESMKARVVQQRLEREKQEAEQRRVVEERKLNPPRYV
ncbi:hypothetical protein BDP27DRAFT_1335335 [Rhodocollybia butyracea]|uniref:Uncharacterized protein n=1 Tax=Rhodocollybia butyracea TaxID=206335 RepID=A0A9P5PHE6_9AGAR|nr:hypothetical protein BDP27DRAFT_1335335 [Rhodocollybia butyracea]